MGLSSLDLSPLEVQEPVPVDTDGQPHLRPVTLEPS